MKRLTSTAAIAALMLAGHGQASAATQYFDTVNHGLLDIYVPTSLNQTDVGHFSGGLDIDGQFFHPIQLVASNTGNGEYIFDFFLTESKPAVLTFSASFISEYWEAAARFSVNTLPTATFTYTRLCCTNRVSDGMTPTPGGPMPQQPPARFWDGRSG